MRIIQQKIREIQRNWNSQKSSFISHKRDAFTSNWLIGLSHQQEHHRDKTRTFLSHCLAQWHACALQEHAFTVFDPKVSARMTCNRQWFMGCSKNQRHYYLCVTFFPPFICSPVYIFCCCSFRFVIDVVVHFCHCALRFRLGLIKWVCVWKRVECR